MGLNHGHAQSKCGLHVTSPACPPPEQHLPGPDRQRVQAPRKEGEDGGVGIRSDDRAR